MADSFSGARLKVERAKRHIQELHAILVAFNQSDFCKLVIERDPEDRHDVLKLISLADAPPAMSLAIGDAVHNMRSAFDYVTTHFVGKDNNRISFPVGTKREDLIASYNLRTIQAALPDFGRFILDEIQPYKGGKFPVWEIGQLDNIDKHKLLIPAISVQRLTGVSAEDDNRNRFSDMTLGVGEGGVLNAVANDSPGFKITSYGKASADIFFAKGDLFEHQPIIPTLVNLLNGANQAISAMETFCFGAVADPNTIPS